jgi:hypothetical protein
MSLAISDTQRVKVWSWEIKTGYAVVKMGSSRKDKKTGEYKNSNWSFVRFMGDAYNKIDSENLKEGDTIVLKGASISWEAYMKDNVKEFPKNPSITVFNWEHYQADNSKNSRMDTPPQIEEDEDNLPF